MALAPTNQLVQTAIAFELEQTQQQLNQQLNLGVRGFDIKHLTIIKQQLLTIENLPTFRIQGTYDLAFKLPKRQLKQLQKPFEVYLQIQKEGKTWRLLVPIRDTKNSEQVWRSYLLQ